MLRSAPLILAVEARIVVVQRARRLITDRLRNRSALKHPGAALQRRLIKFGRRAGIKALEVNHEWIGAGNAGAASRGSISSKEGGKIGEVRLKGIKKRK